MFYSP